MLGPGNNNQHHPRPPRHQTADTPTAQVVIKTTDGPEATLEIPRSFLRQLRAQAGDDGGNQVVGSTAGPSSRALQAVMVGLFLSAAVALFGLWLLKRRGRQQSSYTPLIVIGAAVIGLFSTATALADIPPPPGPGGSSNPLIKLVLAGVFLSLSIAAAGIWAVRRRRAGWSRGKAWGSGALIAAVLLVVFLIADVLAGAVLADVIVPQPKADPGSLPQAIVNGQLSGSVKVLITSSGDQIILSVPKSADSSGK